MGSHRIQIELSEDAYSLLRSMVDSGEYQSGSHAIENIIAEWRDAEPPMDSAEFERWMREDVIPAADELEADPSSGLTPEQLRAYLAEARKTRAEPA